MALHCNRLGFFVVLFLGLGALCWTLSLRATRAQEPVQKNPAPTTASPSGQPAQDAVAYPDHVQPQAYYRHRRRSIVHHYPYPYPGYYYNDETAGFRNPGRVGRHAEYYLPGDQFQVQGVDPVRVARFAEGGYPSRSEQLAAQQVGIARYNSIQRHIDNYAMPRFGFGFGVGGFGGFW